MIHECPKCGLPYDLPKDGLVTCPNGHTELFTDPRHDAAIKVQSRDLKRAAQGIGATLNERGNRYGLFARHADITQNIKRAMADSPNWDTLTPAHREALEMIAHKVGRILNGDPNYKDSWVDIEGYAHLVSETLIDG